MANHYFFAVPLPADVKQRIHEECESLSQELLFHKWVHQEDYHITLAFLGGADFGQVKEAMASMRQPLQQLSPFTLTLDSLGVFGKPQNPRIFWLGVKESSVLNKTRDVVYKACESAGFSLDKRPFSPHITVARKWIGSENFDLSLLNHTALTDTFTVDKVVLYETHLHKTPKYKVAETLFFHHND
ncbi:RNA 2',3'-cyclic phosphodiesterase [Bacillus carboniphilus]|uniref:RNA 2',3'-cyclic phosphodiesterase n=1 Tax=Bacillus carboniphilus TaxID=86663 RepID=A0ABP3G292_9BACI